MFLAILAFVLVIFIHELGHYMVGRLCGIGVTAFSIGFGPKLISLIDKNNTEWKLCLIPLGGFVQFQTNNKILQPKTRDNYKLKVTQCDFESASIVARSLTVMAGPFANFLMSVLIFAFVAMMTGTMSNKPIIGEVVQLPNNGNSLIAGDQILSIQGRQIENFSEIYEFFTEIGKNETIDFRVSRRGKTLDVEVPHLFQPVVFHVEMFSPAMKAGIETGDVVSDFKIENLNRPNKAIIYPFSLILLFIFGYFNSKRKKN